MPADNGQPADVSTRRKRLMIEAAAEIIADSDVMDDALVLGRRIVDRILAIMRRERALTAISDFAKHQSRDDRHPYTCGKREGHPERWGDRGVLYPALQPDGTPILVCPDCGYTQPFPRLRAPEREKEGGEG